MTSEELEVLVSRRQSLKDLKKAPGWLILEEILREQIESRKAVELAFDIESQDDALKLSKLKAERRAMLLLLDLPGTIVEEITMDLEEEDPNGATDDN